MIAMGLKAKWGPSVSAIKATGTTGEAQGNRDSLPSPCSFVRHTSLFFPVTDHGLGEPWSGMEAMWTVVALVSICNT